MANLDDLIRFIESNAPSPEPSSTWVTTRKWEAELTGAIRDWRAIAARALDTPTDWAKLDNVRPPRDYIYLCEALVNGVGLTLAKRWCRSSVDAQARAAAQWLENNLSSWSEFDRDMKALAIIERLRSLWCDLSADLNHIDWNGLDEEMKGTLVTAFFDKHPGEPFESMKALRGRDPNRMPVWFSLPFGPGYVPAPEVSHLRHVILDARDDSWLKRVDEMISTRREACRNRTPQPQRLSYSPGANERELIARLLEITRRGGYLPAALPPIFVSFETPPIFVAYPELEGEGDDDRDRNERREDRQDRIPRFNNRGRPETISIEELLGVYRPRQEQIVIYERGIRWRRNRVDPEWLRAVVLIHEIGHWITHVLPKPGIPAWATGLYLLGSRDVHEGWAQLMTWWIAEQVGGRFKATFEELNRNQSPPYHVFAQFKGEPTDRMMASLERLRLLTWPARLQDWRAAMR